MGYIGPVVVDYLRRSYPKATLSGFDVGYFGSCVTALDVLPECKLDAQYFGDVRRFPVHILRGIDAVVHLAAISNDPIGDRFEDVTLDVNYRASVQLAASAKEAGAKSFVFASSCSMYGTAEDAATTEESASNPLTAYARSKVFTERDLKPLASDRFRITSLRFSTACGWSDRLRLDLVLNDFVAGAIASRRITILSDGTPWRPLIDVKDMARAIDWAVSRDARNGGDFLAANIGSDGWNFQVRDLAEAVARVIPGVAVSINKDAQPDKRSYRVSFDLFRKLAPKHQPQAKLADSIKELKAGLESIHFRDAEFRKSRYMRLNMLTELQARGYLNDQLQWTKQSQAKSPFC